MSQDSYILSQLVPSVPGGQWQVYSGQYTSVLGLYILRHRPAFLHGGGSPGAETQPEIQQLILSHARENGVSSENHLQGAQTNDPDNPVTH